MHKIRFQQFKPLFPIILHIFDLFDHIGSIRATLIIQKVRFQKFKPLSPVILHIFDLECPNQPYLKIFMKFRKLKILHLTNKKLDCHKTYYFYYIIHSEFYVAQNFI